MTEQAAINVPAGIRHYFASTSVERDASHQAWRLPAAVGAGSTFIDLTVDLQRSKQISYRTADGHVHELSVALGGHWSHADLIALAGGSPATLSGFMGAFSSNAMASKQVVYLTADGHVHELSVSLGGRWTHADLSAMTSAPPAAPGGLMGAFASEAMGSKQVAYLTADGHVHELSVALGGNWSHADLSAMTGAPPASPGGFLGAFAFEGQRAKQVAYLTADGHVHELSVALGGHWSHADLSAMTGAPPAAPGGLMGAFASEALGSKQFAYRSEDGHIHELSVPMTGSWLHADLSSMTGAPPAA